MSQNPLRVVFMGTPEFAVPALRSLINTQHSDLQVVACYTQPDRQVGRGLEVKFSPVKTVALEAGIPVFQPEKLSAPGEFEKLQELRPDLIVVVAFGQILKANVLALPRLGCVNIHSSLLPRWRGAAPIQWAIMSGDNRTGVSVMKLVEKLDAGDILSQAETEISAADTAGSLHDRLAEMGAKLIVPTLLDLASGRVQGVPQDEAQVVYASKLTKDMEWLDPMMAAAELERRVRALNPWPGTSIWVESLGRIKVKSAQEVKPTQFFGRPLGLGEINWVGSDLCLGTTSGALRLKTLQWEGKKESDALAWANGLKGRGEDLPIVASVPSPGTSTREN